MYMSESEYSIQSVVVTAFAKLTNIIRGEQGLHNAHVLLLIK